MHFIPQSLLSSPILPSYKRSRKVVFEFGTHDLESLRYLCRKMGSGFVSTEKLNCTNMEKSYKFPKIKTSFSVAKK